MERPNPNFLYDTTQNLDYSNSASPPTSSIKKLPSLPVTPPSDRHRSRYDRYQPQSPSLDANLNEGSMTPMIKITEDQYEYNDQLMSSVSDLLPPSAFFTNSNNRRMSNNSAGGGSNSRRNSLYGSQNLEAAFLSMNIPGGNVPGNRNSLSALKYTPQPSMPARDTSPAPQSAQLAGASSIQSQPMAQQASSSSSVGSQTRSPARNLNKNMLNRNRSPSPRKFSPFNFKSTNFSSDSNSLNLNPPANINRASHRKGHRYKHSSVSMNIIPEPKLRAPLKVHASYTIPNLSEFIGSLTREQGWKLLWSGFHLFTSLVTFLIGFKYDVHSFATLSHLIFYDAMSCIIVVLVNVMANFDVWGKSSIKFPFGLGRLEVLMGFALSLSLIFVGCDLLSHFMEELMASVIISATTATALEDEGHNHGSEHSHRHGEKRLNIFAYELVLILNIVITLISSQFVVQSTKNAQPLTTSEENGQQGSSKALLKRTINSSSIVSNPSHLVTLVFSTYLIFQPLMIDFGSDFFINEIFTLLIAGFICYMGGKVVKYLGYVVLLSFPGATTTPADASDEVVNDENLSEKIKTQIMELDEFKSNCTITNLIISKVHMKLIIVLIKIKMYGGSDDDEVSLRLRIHDTVLKSRETFYSTGDNSTTVESTIDINRL